MFSHLPPSSLSVCEHVCTNPTAADTQTGGGGKHLAPMKAVSGNFTLSHACSHVGLPRANSLPVSAAERAQDAPSGDARVKQAAQVGGGGVGRLLEEGQEKEGEGLSY